MCAKPRGIFSLPIIVSILTLVIGVMFSELHSRVGWTPIIVSLGCFLLVYVVTLVVIGRQYEPMCVGLLQQVKNTVTGLIDPMRIGIIDNEGLALVESSRKDKQIWLVTGDLAEDVPGGPFFDIVHQNLKKGVRYVYFCPKSIKNEGRVAAIAQAHGLKKADIQFVYLPDDFFFLTPRLDFCIYDPFNTTGTRTGYMGLPITTEKHLHCPIDDELLDSLVGKMGAYLNKEEEI